MTAKSKMMGLVEQVLDEIQLSEGSDTEITVALIRAHWDAVHPTTPVPAPGTIRNNLERLADAGYLQRLPTGKSWIFVKPEPAESVAQEAPVKEKDEWVEIVATPRVPTREISDILVRINPYGKIPTVTIRIKRSYAESDRVKLYQSQRGNKLALEFVESEGRKLGQFDKKSKDILLTRLTGSQAEAVIENLKGLRLPYSFRFNAEDVKRQGALHVLEFVQD